MPYIRRRRRRRRRRYFRRRRRNYRRKRRSYNRNVSIRRMPPIFPDAVRVPLKTSALIQPANVAGGFTYTVRINDPNAPGTNLGQPLGYDQWSVFYQRCFCYGSRIHIKILLSASEPGEVVMYPSNVIAAASTLDQAKEQPYSKYTAYGSVNSNMGSMYAYLKNKMTMRKIVGRPLQGVNYEALTGSSPARVAYWNLFGEVLDGSVNQLYLRVTVTYWCRFYQRITLDES